MEYEVVLLQKAERQLSSFPEWLREAVESDLGDLSRSPSTFARTVVSPPYPPGGMVSEFDHGPIAGTLHHIAVFFHYSQDETRLIVSAIGHTRLAVPESEG
jgi:hypothetical protein